MGWSRAGCPVWGCRGGGFKAVLFCSPLCCSVTAPWEAPALLSSCCAAEQPQRSLSALLPLGQDPPQAGAALSPKARN